MRSGCDHGEDYDADDEGDVAICYGGQGQSTGDTGDCCPSDLDNGVQRGNDFVRPPAKSISADRDYERSVLSSDRLRGVWRSYSGEDQWEHQTLRQTQWLHHRA